MKRKTERESERDTQLSGKHRKVITQIQLRSDCCSIAVILYS